MKTRSTSAIFHPSENVLDGQRNSFQHKTQFHQGAFYYKQLTLSQVDNGKVPEFRAGW
jgi:hypothetical protein